LNTPAESNSGPLIITKLSIPQLRAGLVERPHLARQMRESHMRSLTLVCAPAGYGKTTLLIDWISTLEQASAAPRPILCWVSLNADDDEPLRFMSYLLAAFELSNAGISDAARTMLQTPSLPPFQTFVGVLINDLEKVARTVYLILDDYQFISNQAIHDGMAFFLPPGGTSASRLPQESLSRLSL
jgi:LuxR family transcriptional regulator, maltose regulon positive regulatory protein